MKISFFIYYSSFILYFVFFSLSFFYVVFVVVVASIKHHRRQRRIDLIESCFSFRFGSISGVCENENKNKIPSIYNVILAKKERFWYCCCYKPMDVQKINNNNNNENILLLLNLEKRILNLWRNEETLKIVLFLFRLFENK